MTINDLEQAVDWAAQEGWNPGLHDAPCFFQTDPSGFFMAWDGDTPIGAISAVAYDATFGFIGFFMVKPPYRGHRVGIDLGRVARAYLGPRNVGLDGVEAKVHNYETHGYHFAYRNIRYEGTTAPQPTRAENIVPLSQVPFAQLLEYDRCCFPASRPSFLRSWISLPDSCSLAFMDQDALRGFGTIRQCRSGYKIGPLFADDPATAQTLFHALQQSTPALSTFYLDTPECNPEAILLAESHNMHPVFATARMYSRKSPVLDLHHIFGVTSFELG